ncbi:hypothetical protein BDV98DRAFT_561901 [Pterulicium gracile]|uniref:Uncharacterized protein n=1 Tax=Pterulicium gracile TaxID=1884261 RepID=A0A5C3QTJ8_9AGAR|nr:hypothetical protein BDV98DRAFT_561901 [Pterula gracilis]
MPRGIPNAKRDETGLKYTTFHVPLLPNPKQSGSNYLKSESQTIWNRDRPSSSAPVETADSLNLKRGSRVLVIHPGSKFLRIGRASDFKPISVPAIVARRLHNFFTERWPASPRRIIREEDGLNEVISGVSTSLTERMRFFKLRPIPRGQTTASCSGYNMRARPEIIPEHNDPFRVVWVDNGEKEVLVGEKATRITDSRKLKYAIRRPWMGHDFNTDAYPSRQALLSDVEAIIQHGLEQPALNIPPKDYSMYSVILVIPDLYSREYVNAMVNLLLVNFGFMRICLQQESLSATYGAGLTSSLVVDIGATTTSIACVDEGLVIPDSRISLSVGSDDITEFLGILLQKVGFPTGRLGVSGLMKEPWVGVEGMLEIDTPVPNEGDEAPWRWESLEEIKFGMCSLNEADVATNLHTFFVRRPGKPAEKYQMKAYDEIIMAPMCLFTMSMIDFASKRTKPSSRSEYICDEVLERHSMDQVTQAMVISTNHLVPVTQPAEVAASDAETKKPEETTAENPSASTSDEANSTDASGTPAPDPTPQDDGAQKDESPAMDIDVVTTEDTPAPISIDDNPPPAQPVAQPAPPNATAQTSSATTQTSTTEPQPPTPKIEIPFEASKLPLDVAIFNSARAAGGDDKIRKYLQSVLVVGGTALTPGLHPALESRLQAIATPLVANMEKVQIIPPPREIDPRVVVWKGASVLGKMEGVSELWVRRAEWDLLGMRAIKERCFFL